MEEIPIVDLKDKYAITTDLSIALVNNYIGEITIIPILLTNAIRLELKLPQYKEELLIYYGTPNKRLKQLFGYKQ